MHRTLTVCLGALLASGCSLLGAEKVSAPRAPEDAERACQGLSGRKLAGAVITRAAMVAAPAGWEPPASLFNAVAPTPKIVRPFCRVQARIELEIEVEVWLPTAWNGKYLGVGNGGLSGDLNYPAMADGLARGYAVASTDTGHRNRKGFYDTEWIPGRRDRVLNFGYRAHHLTALAGKAISAFYYGRTPQYAYFNGCSSGGWQGLTEVQKFPNDYDGVIAGAPATNFVRGQLRETWLTKISREDPQSDLSPVQIQAAAEAAVGRCDLTDGVADGVIGDPMGCDFDPVQLACRPGQAGTCLRPGQVARLRLLYGPVASPEGLSLYPGPAYGTVVAPPSGDNEPRPIIQLMSPDQKIAVATFDADDAIARLEREFGASLSARRADLSRFRATGGKLILYHGWADPIISPYNTIEYYERAARASGGDPASFMRLYMAPGMQHCRGGAGPDVFDMLSALEGWVEDGVGPTVVEAVRKDVVEQSRPLCRFPLIATYRGAGDPNMAKSFRCAPSQGRR